MGVSMRSSILINLRDSVKSSMHNRASLLGVLMFIYTFFIPVISEGVNAYEVTLDFHSGALWGTFSDHEISANTMYCATVLGLAVVDVTDPSNPQELSVLYFGDVDCSGAIDIDDIAYLVLYLFAGGPEPCNG